MARNSRRLIRAAILFKESFLMDYLNRLQAHRGASRPDARENRRNPDAAKREEQQPRGPMKPDGPAERLNVDDVDQDQRKQAAQREPENVSKQAKHARFAKNEAANLRA